MEHVPYKSRTRLRTKKGIALGKIPRSSKCEKCGSSEGLQVHHYDYANPLDIIWLCAFCHRGEHLEDRRADIIEAQKKPRKRH